MKWNILRTRSGASHASHDVVVLADGQVVLAPRANLAAAKAVYAAKKRAERQVAESRYARPRLVDLRPDSGMVPLRMASVTDVEWERQPFAEMRAG